MFLLFPKNYTFQSTELANLVYIISRLFHLILWWNTWIGCVQCQHRDYSDISDTDAQMLRNTKQLKYK